jgi:hypothetical protein
LFLPLTKSRLLAQREENVKMRNLAEENLRSVVMETVNTVVVVAADLAVAVECKTYLFS